jgi:hypothetical protein
MNPNYREAKELCQAARDRRLKELQLADTVGEEAVRLMSVVEFLIYLKLDMRLYVVSTFTHIEDIWSVIRNDEVILDFVLGLTAELRALYESVEEHPNNDWKRLVDALADAYGRVGHADKSAMDADTFDRLPEGSDLKEGLNHNAWLVTLFLLEGIELPMETDDVLKNRSRGK